jgi:hypothetical protein
MLQTIKDKNKKTAVENIDSKFISINNKYTNSYTVVLSNLQKILTNLSLKSTELAISKEEIATSQAAIDDAKKIVENQTTKTYIITISTESMLKSDVKATVKQLRQDLKVMYDIVTKARKTVLLLEQNVLSKSSDPARLESELWIQK